LFQSIFTGENNAVVQRSFSSFVKIINY